MIRCLAALAAILLASLASATEARVAIIIDDLGYRQADSLRAVNLPGPVAVAILPGAPAARSLASRAHAENKEVLVHLPLQAVVEDGLDEPGSIGLDTGRSAFNEAFARAVTSVPYASGVNNHRGSLLTRHPGHMRWLMEEILKHDEWFFIDSYTTRHSVALTVAREHGVPSARRDVFLDSDRDRDSIAREFERLKRLAQKNGSAIAIGHPFPETLDFLETAIPALEKEGIRLVPLTILLEPAAEPKPWPGIAAAP